jgi:hypothetical protein
MRRDADGCRIAAMTGEVHNPQISIHKIPVKGGLGSLLVIIILVSAMLVELPELRAPTLYAIAGGVILALVRILWRRHHQ